MILELSISERLLHPRRGLYPASGRLFDRSTFYSSRVSYNINNEFRIFGLIRSGGAHLGTVEFIKKEFKSEPNVT